MTLKHKFTVRGKKFLINRLIDAAESGKLTKSTVHQMFKEDQLEVMGVEILENPVTHKEQEVQQAFGQRRSIAFELAKTLKLIRSETVPGIFPMNGNGQDQHIWVNRCVATRLGRIYRRLPSSLQVSALWLVTFAIQFTATLTKFKWLTGVISFVVLAAKVWHSGAIDKAWIGISAASGIAVVWLLSLWR